MILNVTYIHQIINACKKNQIFSESIINHNHIFRILDQDNIYLASIFSLQKA